MGDEHFAHVPITFHTCVLAIDQSIAVRSGRNKVARDNVLGIGT